MHMTAATSAEFPSVLADDAMGPSPYHAALFFLRQGLHALHALAPGDESQRSEREQLITMQKQVLQLLHIHFAPANEGSDVRPFGALLRQHREEAGLTQEQLSEYSGLSLSYVRKLEQGKKPPARKAVLSLSSVADLKLVPSEVTALPAIRESSYRQAPNWYVSPGFDSVQMMAELSRQLNGGGGAVEQTYVYLDHKSALDWIQLCNTPSYVAVYRDNMPHAAITAKLREVVGQAGMDVIALGPGDGKNEVRLVQHVRSELEDSSIRFYLLDASQPLLSTSFKYAMDTFDDDAGVFVCGIQGNFHHLPRYLQLHYSPARSHRRRIYLMLGNTIANLDNEPQFFQSAFVGAAPGDVLIFDVDYSFTTSPDPAEIERCDPAFRKPLNSEGHVRWLAGPIQRYCQDVQDITFSLRLDSNRPLQGSYGLQFMAHVTLAGMRSKEFCMLHARRYDPSQLIHCLRKLGWEHIGLFPFTGSQTRPRGVFMFQKRTPGLKH